MCAKLDRDNLGSVVNDLAKQILNHLLLGDGVGNSPKCQCSFGDPAGGKRGHILAEVPLGKKWCPLRKAVFSWTKKGTKFKRFQDSSKPITLKVHPVVVVWGKGFFDTHHAKKNPLANRSLIDDTGLLAAWEIHPVSAITPPH